MKVITLSKCKESLGISGDTLDVFITKQIPLIDAKVKQIAKNNFNQRVCGDVTVDSPYVTISSIHNTGSLTEYLEVGQLIEGEGIPEDTYIEEVYAGESPNIKLSENATATTAGNILQLGINICYQDIIAKGIWYAYSKVNRTLPGRTISSVGTVSFANEDNTIDGRYGMPAWFVKALPQFVGGH